MNQIRIESQLTDRQYRRYMNFHVLGNRRDVAIHISICALIIIFGRVNFRTGSPVLGWIFVTLGAYVFISRFFRFYTSVNRIIHEFGLSEEPKFFYTVTFRDDGFEVRNATEKADYELNGERIYRACFREKEHILYLYLTKVNAFLLPYASFTQGTPEDLKKLLAEKCGNDKVMVYDNR